jgi:putative ABC transport system ATP-binding protein
MTALIEMRGITRTYNRTGAAIHALQGVDLALAQGDVLAVMGASGSGKSTLLNVLGCLDRPTSGDYRLSGTDVTRLDDEALSRARSTLIGFVFQSFHLIPHLTVLENVLLPTCYQHPPADIRKRAGGLLARMGLGDRRSHRPGQLSGGEQQRAAIARALIHQPAVLLADEPTGNLDSGTTMEILSIFQDLAAEGTTMVIVTHNRQVADLAQRILWMTDGRLSESP